MGHYVDTMAYSGQLPWHGLGTYVGDVAVSAERMIEAAKLGWNVESAAVASVRVGGESFDVDSNGQRVLVRMDRGTILGACKGTYVPFQNREVFAFLDSLKAETGLRYHTAGSLKDGAKVWALAQLPGEFVVKRRSGEVDSHCPFLLMSAGHDGATAIQLQPTDVRVVCWNTLTYAEGKAGWQGLTIKHTASAAQKIDKARELLGCVVEHSRELNAVAQELANTPMDRREFIEFASAVLLDLEMDRAEARDAIAERTEAMTERARHGFENKLGDALAHFEHGTGNHGQDRYDALNALTEWIDQKRARSRKAAEAVAQQSRIADSAMFGTGAERKKRAVRLLTRW